MRSTDCVKATGVAATADVDPFQLDGGTYLFVAHVNSGSGLSATMGVLSADGTSYVTLFSALAHVDGIAVLFLPPGQYQFQVTGSAGGGESFDLSVSRVPSD